MTDFYDRSTGDHVDLSDTDFTPGSAHYGGSAYQFQKTNPDTGEIGRVSQALASMMGRNTANDVQAHVPTGATTDFTTAHSGNDNEAVRAAEHYGFTPNNHGNQMGAWN